MDGLIFSSSLNHKKLNMRFLTTIILSINAIFLSQAQVIAPALSPLSTVSQTIGLTEIEIEYFRPSVRGRRIIGNGGIIPYGEHWRTGANGVTKLTFSEDIEIAGQALKKGAYTILSVLQADTWTLHFYPYERLPWNDFVQKTPVISVTAKRQITKEIVETFYIGYENIQLDKADLVFSWENTRIKIPINASAKEKMLKRIKRTMAGPRPNDYYQAALYLHEANLNLEDALKYIQKVTKSEKATFFQVYREAVILQDLNRSKEAVVVAKRGKALAEAIGNMDFVRLNEKIIKNH